MATIRFKSLCHNASMGFDSPHLHRNVELALQAYNGLSVTLDRKFLPPMALKSAVGPFKPKL